MSEVGVFLAGRKRRAAIMGDIAGKKEAVPLLKVEDFALIFSVFKKGLREQRFHVIRQLEVEIYAGEVVAVIGASGSGKSLFADAILGILPDNANCSGNLFYKGERLTKKRQKELRGKEISYIPQSVNALNPLMKVGKQMKGRREWAKGYGEMGTRRKVKKKFFRKTIFMDEGNKDVDLGSIFQKVTLDEKVKELYPFELSGGMARRILATTAFNGDPQLIIADEPTPGLDDTALCEVITYFRMLANAGKGVMLITHDIVTALKIADRVVIMNDGKMVETVRVEDFSGKGEGLKHPYTRALWHALPQNLFILSGEEAKYKMIIRKRKFKLDLGKRNRNIGDSSTGLSTGGAVRWENGVKLKRIVRGRRLDRKSRGRNHIEFDGVRSAGERRNTGRDGDGILVDYVSYRFNERDYLFQNVHFEIKRGEIVGLMGKSGVGKTTLGKIIAGYERAHTGSIYVDGKKTGKSHSFLYRNSNNPIQMVWQHPEQTFNPKWSMKQVLQESNTLNDELLEMFGLREEWLRRWPSELSGGELQRFAIVRALGKGTEFLILDEVTTMVDAITQAEIWQVLLKIISERNMGVLAISHDHHLLKRICNRIIRMEHGYAVHAPYRDSHAHADAHMH